MLSNNALTWILVFLIVIFFFSSFFVITLGVFMEQERRKLRAAGHEEMFDYCKNDVKKTAEVFDQEKDYRR